MKFRKRNYACAAGPVLVMAILAGVTTVPIARVADIVLDHVL